MKEIRKIWMETNHIFNLSYNVKVLTKNRLQYGKKVLFSIFRNEK